MNTIITYFESISSLHRGLILVGGITIFWLIENAFPLFRFRYHKIKHASLNIFFTLTTIVINFVMAFILLLAADFAVTHQFGILQWLPEMNVWIYALVGLLLLDFIGAYLVHLIEHKVTFLWRFHLIHHTDT